MTAKEMLIHAPVMPENSKLTFVQRINELENKKMELFLKGAWFQPELVREMKLIDQKLEKYYRWYTTAMMAGIL